MRYEIYTMQPDKWF